MIELQALDALDTLVFFLLSFLTAFMSACTGLGGGVIFLLGLNILMPIKSVIPTHGLVQLKNNALRVYKLRAHLNYNLCSRFLFGMVFGVLIVYFVVKNLESSTFALILIFLLVAYSLFKPKKLPELILPNWGFVILGLVTGFLGILVGAVDPILSPFFLRSDFSRQQLIANKSFFQMCVHISKIPVFLSLGFNYLEYLSVIIVLLIGGFVGTSFGIKVLHKIDQKLFIKIFKSVLFLVWLRLGFKIIQPYI